MTRRPVPVFHRPMTRRRAAALVSAGVVSSVVVFLAWGRHLPDYLGIAG